MFWSNSIEKIADIWDGAEGWHADSTVFKEGGRRNFIIQYWLTRTLSTPSIENVSSLNWPQVAKRKLPEGLIRFWAALENLRPYLDQSILYMTDSSTHLEEGEEYVEIVNGSSVSPTYTSISPKFRIHMCKHIHALHTHVGVKSESFFVNHMTEIPLFCPKIIRVIFFLIPNSLFPSASP